MLIIEEREKVEAAVERLKLAHVSHDPQFWGRQLFPLIYGGASMEPEKVEVEVNPEDIGMDTMGEWKFKDNVKQEDAEAILRDLMENPTGRVNGADVEWV